jgi:asparagine synthase (glutamine-hydrolysing)
VPWGRFCRRDRLLHRDYLDAGTEPAAIQTFTIGFTIEAYDEARYVKAVAARLGTDHTELYVTPSETLEVIPKLPAIYWRGLG